MEFVQSLLFSGLSNHNSLRLLGEVLQPLQGASLWPPLDVHVHVFLALGPQSWTQHFRWGVKRAKQSGRITWPAGHTLSGAAHDEVGFLHSEQSLFMSRFSSTEPPVREVLSRSPSLYSCLGLPQPRFSN